MSSNEAQKLLEKCAPLAARKLVEYATQGSTMKADSEGYKAVLEILDRTGHSKKTETTIKHTGLPELPKEAIIGAFLGMAKMFSVEEDLKDLKDVTESTFVTLPESEISTPQQETKTQESLPTEGEEFTISEEIKD